ncbi:hypothetical protein BKP45_21260 [Anaerobacillus alkalidiazotrophicus]|uniref:Uncharacterized protein n=1 Tax=Anaerobacillus alkalidiazotrophicus TaxID=472963 RepID=A0A1S2LW40_9BACI|nr:hypothetical protein [Anaerobacillus alkalidiazotrophicus]OIJ16534.1 hypothetical protein BKP45_21260 [Anaerobacillus alkalidiazotrophicus]
MKVSKNQLFEMAQMFLNEGELEEFVVLYSKRNSRRPSIRLEAELKLYRYLEKIQKEMEDKMKTFA